MIVIGLDPSLTGFGFSLLETIGQRTLLKRAGVWETWADRTVKKASADNNDRFAYLAQQLWIFGQEVKPERIYVEGLIYMPATNFAAISSAGRSRGLVDALAAALQIEAVEVSAVSVKKGLGIMTKREEGLASKDEVRNAIFRLYPIAADMVPMTKAGENVSDAIAVAHVGLQASAYSDRLRSGSSR